MRERPQAQQPMAPHSPSFHCVFTPSGVIADEILATADLVEIALVTVHKPSAPVNAVTSDINVMVIRTR